MIRTVHLVLFLYVVCCANWYHLYNLKSVKNPHGGVLLLVKLQALTFFKFYKFYQIVQSITLFEYKITGSEI